MLIVAGQLAKFRINCNALRHPFNALPFDASRLVAHQMQFQLPRIRLEKPWSLKTCDQNTTKTLNIIHQVLSGKYFLTEQCSALSGCKILESQFCLSISADCWCIATQGGFNDNLSGRPCEIVQSISTITCR